MVVAIVLARSQERCRDRTWRQFDGMYDVKSVWPAEKLARLRADAARLAETARA